MPWTLRTVGESVDSRQLRDRLKNLAENYKPSWGETPDMNALRDRVRRYAKGLLE